MIRVSCADHFAALRPAQLVAVHGRSFEWLDIRTNKIAQLRDPVTHERVWVPLAAITVPTRPQWAPTHPAVRDAARPLCTYFRRFISRENVRAKVDHGETA